VKNVGEQNTIPADSDEEYCDDDDDDDNNDNSNNNNNNSNNVGNERLAVAMRFRCGALKMVVRPCFSAECVVWVILRKERICRVTKTT
jgi:hypothetical protein